MTTTSGSKMLTKLAIAGAEVAGRSPPAPRRLRLARLGRARRARAPFAPGAVELARDAVRRRPGRDRLEMPVAAAAAGRAVELDHDVAELGPAPGRAAVRLPVEDQAAADAGAEREHHDVAAPRARRRPATRRSPRRCRRCRSRPAGRAARASASRKSTPASGMFTDLSARAGALVDPRRDAEAQRRHVGLGAVQLLDQRVELGEQRVLRGDGRSDARAGRRASRRAMTTAARIFVPPTSTPMTRDCSKTARVPYAAGCRRPAERSPTASTGAGAEGAGADGRPAREVGAARARPSATGAAATAARARSRAARRPRQIRWGRELTIALVLIVVFFIAWAALGYLVFRGGVSDANKRLPQSARARADARQRAACSRPRRRSCCSAPTTRLAAARAGDRHSDSITLLRTDPAASPALLPLDPPRPARRDPRLRRARRSTRPSRSAARASPHDGLGVHRHPDQPHRRRQLRRVQGPDRRGRRDRRRRHRSRSSRSSTARTRTEARCARWPGWRFARASST